MQSISQQERLFLIWSYSVQVALIVHFILRRWAFERYTWQYGWVVYALAIPALVVSLILLRNGAHWSLWTGGFIYLAWAGFGFIVEYLHRIPWRNPPYWPVFGPYITLYLSMQMFYWWPLGRLGRGYWFIYAALFILSTVLNVLSHR